MTEAAAERLVRVSARVYAVASALGGALMLAFIALLAVAFGTHGLFEPKIVAFMIVPGIFGIALAPFIWRQQAWAMIAALVITIAITFLFSQESATLRVALPSASVLFAVLTGLRFWLGPPR